MIKPIETERLHLISTTYDHASQLLELLNSPKWIKNIGDRKVYTLEEAKAYVDKVKGEENIELQFGQRCIIRKSDGAFLGVTGIYQRKGLDHADIGFALLTEHEGKGYAYEASNALLDQIIAIGKSKEVQAITLPENKASIRLIEKLGLRFEKVIRLPNEEIELNLYTIKL